MARPDDSSPQAAGARRARPVLTIVLVVIAAIIVLVFVAPLFVDVNDFRPQIENQLSSALGRKVTLGKISLAFYSGNLVAENIAIADDPAYSQAPFLQAKSLHVGVHVWPLLFHHQLEVTHLTIDSPAIQLIQSANGKWNFSSLGGSSPKSSKNQPGSLPDLSVAQFTVSDGSATVSSTPPTGKPLTYSAINVTVNGMSFNRNFPFQLSAKMPAGGSLQLSGNAGPLARQDASDTPFHADVTLKNFDPVAAGVIPPDKGISGQVNVTAQANSDGTQLTSTGKIQAVHLQLARTGSPAPNPVDIDYNISENLDARTGKVEDIALHTGSVAAHVNGTYKLTPQGANLNLRLSAPNMPVDQLLQLLPAVGVKLPSGSSLQGGTLTANLSITGPATATTIAGPVEVDNTTLTGFDLGSKIQGLNPFGGGNGATQIQTIKATVNSSPQISQFTNIFANVPKIGTASGQGTVTPSGALNFQLTAKLSSTQGLGAMASSASKKVGGLIGSLLQGAVGTVQNAGIPLTITGTATSPTIRANLGAMIR
ncbi:MAG: AsmA family protein [Acidobacteriota bacterium]